MVAVVMELYQLAALEGFPPDLGGHDEDDSNKKWLLQNRQGTLYDLKVSHHYEVISTAVCCLLLLIQNVFFCYRTTVDAAAACDEVNGLIPHFYTRSDRDHIYMILESISGHGGI